MPVYPDQIHYHQPDVGYDSLEYDYDGNRVYRDPPRRPPHDATIKRPNPESPTPARFNRRP